MQRVSKRIKELSRVSKEEWREYTRTVWQIANVSDPDHPAVFPEEIPHRLIKLFSFWGETVLDPFAGTGTTAAAALKLGRKAVCVDQNDAYVRRMRKELANIADLENNATILQGDARSLDFLDDNSISLVVTSPPYWNKADYGGTDTDLGSIENYVSFINSILPAFEEMFRVLQPGRKACIVTANVNQYTNHGLLTFPLSTDFGLMMRDVGFVMVNEIIWVKDGTGGKWGSYGKQRPIFGSYPYPPNFLFKNVHEYILIFAKPPRRQRNGKNALNYEELMKLHHLGKLAR